VELDANPYYFRGKPAIAHLTIRFVSEPNTSINQLRTGEADGFFNDEDTGNLPILQSIPNLRVLRTPVNAVGALIYNTQDPVTGDPRVRRALTQALDIPSLVVKTYRGAVDARDAGRGLFEWAYDPHAQLAAKHDLVAAKRLLDEAGWLPGPDGVRAKNGTRLNLLLVIQAKTPGDEIIGSTIQQAERAIGADISIKAYNVTQFVAPAQSNGPVYGGKFQIAYYPFVNGDDPDVTDQFACRNVPPNGYNKSRFCDPALDALLNAGRTSYDLPVRMRIYSKVQQRLSNALPIVLLYQRREIDAFTTRLQNQTTSVSSAFWNVGAWRLAPH
jgi:peptide/nickel transport system substrate-binding protein